MENRVLKKLKEILKKVQHEDMLDVVYTATKELIINAELSSAFPGADFYHTGIWKYILHPPDYYAFTCTGFSFSKNLLVPGFIHRPVKD